MSNPNALFLLADHIKLSLLERKRARSLDLAAGDTQDGHIARSLDQFREGLEGLEKEHKRLEAAGDESKAMDLADALPTLQKQLDDLTSQFHGFSAPSITLTKPNDPSLAADFAHASTLPSATGGGKRSASGGSGPKTVRFSDNTTSHGGNDDGYDRDLEAARSGLFGGGNNNGNSGPYRDDPDGPSYRDRIEGGDGSGAPPMDNVQVHAYHQQVLEEQDAQLDALGASIGRQRELSMQIGDELDSHVAMLDESERLVDRHQDALDRARRQVGRISRSAGEGRQMAIIIALIVVLLLLIAILK
ncbi:hypothetical protein RB595_005307 [Gaeumannomyces hyphopodioides]